MRHSNIKLTMGTYTDPKLLVVREALEKLRPISPNSNPRVESLVTPQVAPTNGKVRHLGPIADTKGQLSKNANLRGRNEKTPENIRGFQRLSTSDPSGDEGDRTPDLLNAIQWAFDGFYRNPVQFQAF
jgi:hypothetical protein